MERVGDRERSLLDAMAKTMYLNSGVGLAAVQIGVSLRMAVVDTGDGIVKLINPSILKKDGSESCEEGCLSVPGAVVKVKRARRISVAFLNEKGDVSRLNAEGLLARAIQHEIDHLDGRLIVDYLDPVRRLLARRKSLTKRR